MANFFSGITQKDIAIRQYAGKSPMFFRRFRLMAGVYTADYAACKACIPNDKFHVLQVLPGRALIGIHCMEYLDSDVGPYNEISVSVGIAPKRTSFSAASIVKSTLTLNFHAYILALPVTTEIAYFGGVDHFNYPKFIANINFEEHNGQRVCVLSDLESGNMIMTFKGKMIRTKKVNSKKNRFDTMTLNSYPVMNGETVHARMHVNMIEKGENYLTANGKLSIGDGNIADMLRMLDLGQQINYQYMPMCESIMYLPQPMGNAG